MPQWLQQHQTSGDRLRTLDLESSERLAFERRSAQPPARSILCLSLKEITFRNAIGVKQRKCVKISVFFWHFGTSFMHFRLLKRVKFKSPKWKEWIPTRKKNLILDKSPRVWKAVFCHSHFAVSAQKMVPPSLVEKACPKNSRSYFPPPLPKKL